MSIKSDRWIREMCRNHQMIEPFEEKQMRQGVISYGVSSYGYDIRIADEFKIFTNVNSTIVDPKNMDPGSMVDFKGPVAIIPPNSFALGRTIEYFRIPRSVLTICLGKCVTGDTRVVDASSGDYVTIRDFVSRARTKTAGLESGRIAELPVQHHMDNGVQTVYELTTWTGLRVKTTAQHPFLTWSGWRPLEELRAGERIAVARSVPVFGRSDWPEHEATLLGLMLADGACHTPGSSPCFTGADPRIVEVFTQSAHAFGCSVTSNGRLGYRLVNRVGRGGVATRNRATAWLEGLGCNVLSRDKHVPPVVFTARRETAAAFLRALFSGDGSVYSSGDGVYLEYATISERLADDVRHLLLRFGVFALVRPRRGRDGYESYRVQVTDRRMLARFGQEIGFIAGSAKQARLDRILELIAVRPWKKSNFDTLPREAWATMRSAAHARGRTLSSCGLARTIPRQSLPFGIARQVATAVEDSELQSQVDADVLWDRIVSIRPAGREPVYDLTVPGAHNFVANDIIVHNSTYARCGIITNVTPFEPEWEGFVTLEISNTTPLPAKIYANEGIAQVLFFESDEVCEVSYRDKAGKYQAQKGITLPRL